MTIFLDTSGNSTLGIGICGRCGEKFPLGELMPDPNTPGLRVCKDDIDVLDPWRLAPREADDLTLEYPRPDLTLTPGPTAVPINQLQAVLGDGVSVAVATEQNQPIAIAPPAATLGVSGVWAPGVTYSVGDQVTAINPIGLAAAGLDIYLFTCLVPGQADVTTPGWTTQTGTTVTDNQVIWLNAGLRL